jgi:CubicO group peptidase (beta-lactamase class C family)
MPPPASRALESIADWPVDAAAAAVRHADGTTRTVGDTRQVFELASLTKLMTAMAALVAHEEGTLDLDEPATDTGASIADLLAHSAGIAPDTPTAHCAPRTRRVYSTAGYEILAERLAAAAAMAFSDYLGEAVLEPLAMSATVLHGSPGAGARSTVDDLLRLIDAWRTPVLVDPSTLRRATTAHLPDLDGVLPGYGRQRPNPWGLGPEIRGAKSPHWTAPTNSATTFGHFGRAGTLLWVDPRADVVLIVLTNRAFGPWAVDAWPTLSEAVLAE